jgi:hemerythrin-like domain-containing protein
MVTYDDLHQQNHKITELTNILHLLLQDRSLCDSEVTCSLFFDYVDRVKEHLDVTDNSLYARLLSSGDQRVKNTASRFMGGSKEIKRIFASYLKKWCKLRQRELAIKQYDEFIAETSEMFEMVLDRIQDETEHLYPLVRQVTGDSRQVA